MSKIAVIGSGYVGLVSGAVLSDFGHNVMCVDVDQKKIESLKQGVIPIYEPGLDALVEKNMQMDTLHFSTDIQAAIQDNDIIFIAVGTPPKDDGSADLQYVLSVAKEIAANMQGYKVIVDKSTVPVGTGQKVKKMVQDILDERGVDYDFDVVSNPEFLREGSAVYDFSNPERVVLGTESQRALDAMIEVYRVLYLNETPFVSTNIETAEMIKYVSNAFLAMKITYINEVANLCEKVGANVQKVARGMGMDDRIGNKFLNAGPGYGGSCFPKDTKALATIAREHGENLTLIETTIQANERQKMRMVEKINDAMGDLSGKVIGVLGLTFKPNTDDMREAPSLVILPELVKRGAAIRAFDPEGTKEGSWRFENIKEHMTFCDDEYCVTQGADAVVILTEWNQFRSLDFDRLKEGMRDHYFFDLRNVYEEAMVEKYGFRYYAVGR
nr:UDP-glucose/GDP-mannose dehydrogenase family protein [uncultured Solibaculum sp.]